MDLELIFKRFPTQEDCINFLEILKWNGNPQCPYCKSTKPTPLPKELRYHCNNCRSSFSVTTRTLFHKTKIELQRWFLAIPLVINKKISARQLGNIINVTKDTACSMISRIKIEHIANPEFINHFVN